jgi:membrane-bound serine protease (ClpP class)
MTLIGITLIVLAIILFIAEVKIQSHGILGIGGLAALVLGGHLLFNTSPRYARVGWPVLGVVAVLAVAFLTLVVTKVRAAMRRPHATGLATLVGRQGVALSPLEPGGQVRVQGEIWKARTRGEILLKDERIEVLSVEGLTLVVRRLAGVDTGSRTELGQQR